MSKIATTVPNPSEDDVDHFWKLYWGRLATVEDKSVDAAMVLFGDKLKEKSSTGCLQDASLLLAHCVKKSLEDAWNVEFGPPPELSCNDASFQRVKDCKCK